MKIFIPFVFLHELTHLLLLHVFGLKKYFKFKIFKQKCGFYPNDPDLKVTKFQIYELLITCYSPLLLIIPYAILVFNYNFFIPKDFSIVEIVWYFYFNAGMILSITPSSGDIKSAKDIYNQIKQNEKII